MQIALLVFIGGSVGCLVRYLITHFFAPKVESGFPWVTFLINTTGAFLMGFLSILVGVSWQDRWADAFSTFILTGFLGGFATFSAMELEGVVFFESEQRALALGYILATVLAGLAAALLGAWVGYNLGVSTG